jgi:glutathione S-transferase
VKPKLYATPLSHFARKVRIVLSELQVPFELVFVGDLLSSDPSDFGGNPILRIPTFRDEDHWIVESDQITRYIVERHDPSDRLGRLQLGPDQRNALSMINAAMAAEVEILLATRSGILDIECFELEDPS